MSIFTPKDEIFFDLFEKQATSAREAVILIKEKLFIAEDISQLLKEIQDLKVKSSGYREKMIDTLSNSFIIPFDHGDIYDLTTYLDEVLLKLMYAIMRINLYELELKEDFADYIEQMLDIIHALTSQIIFIVKLLRNPGNASIIIQRVRKLEQDGDMIEREACSALFHLCQDKPVDIVKWREVYKYFEEVIDLAEDISLMVENILIKHS